MLLSDNLLFTTTDANHKDAIERAKESLVEKEIGEIQTLGDKDEDVFDNS